MSLSGVRFSGCKSSASISRSITEIVRLFPDPVRAKQSLVEEHGWAGGADLPLESIRVMLRRQVRIDAPPA